MSTCTSAAPCPAPSCPHARRLRLAPPPHVHTHVSCTCLHPLVSTQMSAAPTPTVRVWLDEHTALYCTLKGQGLSGLEQVWPVVRAAATGSLLTAEALLLGLPAVVVTSFCMALSRAALSPTITRTEVRTSFALRAQNIAASLHTINHVAPLSHSSIQ